MPPQSLLHRVRWLFLLLNLLMIAVLVPSLAVSPVHWSLRTLAGALLAWLAWRRIREYRRQTLTTLAWDVPEGLAVLVTGLVVGAPRLDDILFSNSFFRALHGSRRRVAVGALGYVAVYLGTSLLASERSPYLALP